MRDKNRNVDEKLEDHGPSWPTGGASGHDTAVAGFPSKTGLIFGHEVGDMRTALSWALKQQVASGFLAGLMLDCGYLLALWKFTMLIFWSGALLILVRRFKSPTLVDLLLIKIGFLPLVGFTMHLNGWVAVWKGMR
jgi:hypothetical protein